MLKAKMQYALLLFIFFAGIKCQSKSPALTIAQTTSWLTTSIMCGYSAKKCAEVTQKAYRFKYQAPHCIKNLFNSYVTQQTIWNVPLICIASSITIVATLISCICLIKALKSSNQLNYGQILYTYSQISRGGSCFY